MGNRYATFSGEELIREHKNADIGITYISKHKKKNYSLEIIDSFGRKIGNVNLETGIEEIYGKKNSKAAKTRGQ